VSIENITQDNSRENQIINLCSLEKQPGRIGVDARDIWHKYPYEIKSVTKNKGVSTARQVHVNKINKWRSIYWIFAKGLKTIDGMTINELFIAHPDDLEPFFKKCENKINDKLKLCKTVLRAAKKQKISKTILDTVKKTMEVGTRLDDPCIPWKLITENGTPLTKTNKRKIKKEIKSFVEEYPIINPPMNMEFKCVISH